MFCGVGDLIELKTGPRWMPHSTSPLRLGIVTKIVTVPNRSKPYDVLYYVSWLPPYEAYNENNLEFSGHLIPRADTVWYEHEIKAVSKLSPHPIDS
jgi:hypothetical protein